MVFHRARITGGNGFFAFELIPAGASRAAVKRPDRPFIRLQTALRLRPRRALSSAEATGEITSGQTSGKRLGALFSF